MSFKLFGVETADRIMPDLIEISAGNKKFWQRVVQISPLDLSAHDIAQISKHAGDFDKPEDPDAMYNCNGDGNYINRLIARYLINLVPELKEQVQLFRTDVAVVLNNKRAHQVGFEPVEEHTVKQDRNPLQNISNRLAFIDWRINEIDRQIAIHVTSMNQAATVQELNQTVYGGPLEVDHLKLASVLLNKALLNGQLDAISEQNIVRIREVFELLDWSENGADNLPSEGLTNFVAAKRKQDHQRFIIAALKTDKGMKQYFSFIRWECGMNLWSYAAKQKQDLELEKHRLLVEKSQY